MAGMWHQHHLSAITLSLRIAAAPAAATGDSKEGICGMALKVTTTNRVPAFLAMVVMNATRELEATGVDVIHLEVGQPSTPPPVAVNAALLSLIHI